MLYGATVKIHEPVSVIGIACPEERTCWDVCRYLRLLRSGVTWWSSFQASSFLCWRLICIRYVSCIHDGDMTKVLLLKHMHVL